MDKRLLFTLLTVVTVVLVLTISGCSPPNPNSPYGINAHVPDIPVVDFIRDAGIGWIRVDFNWYNLEPEKDSYKWFQMDTVVAYARAQGLSIFATLAYSPEWANGTGNRADPPLDATDWYDFVYDTVSRYKNDVKHWGMWNEPNLTHFFTGTKWQYREMILKPGAQAAKAADPGCFVVGPELAHVYSADWAGWMVEAMSAGGAEHIDIISHHCYPADCTDNVFQCLDRNSNPLLSWGTLLNVLAHLGVDHKPVWLTEVGWRSDQSSEIDQSWHYFQLLAGVIQRPYIHKVFPYEIKDDPTPGVPPWGIVHADLRPKEAYFTYKTFINNYPPPTPLIRANRKRGTDYVEINNENRKEGARKKKWTTCWIFH